MPAGLAPAGLLAVVAVSLVVCVTVCALAMEAAVLFTPAFLFLFPAIAPGFPALTPNEAIGLSLVVEFFGYSSSVAGYWYRRQVDLALAARLLAVTVPLAVLGRVASFAVPSELLLGGFGAMLVGLAAVLYHYHERVDGRACMLCGDSLALAEGRPDCCRRQAEGTGVTDGGDPDYGPRTRLLSAREAGGPLALSAADRGVAAVGGVMAGLVGIAVGEITTTLLTVRKRLPVGLSVGTAALVLHLTVLAALATNLALLELPVGVADSVSVPLEVGLVLAPTVVVGGQLGSLLNSRLPERAAVRAMILAYVSVGLFVLGRVLFLSGLGP